MIIVELDKIHLFVRDEQLYRIISFNEVFVLNVSRYAQFLNNKEEYLMSNK